MASVSFTTIATGTLSPSNGSRHFTWNNVPHADRVHAFWLSIQPIGGALGGGAISEGWITKSSHKVFADPFNRQINVWFEYDTAVTADFTLMMANIAP